MLSWQVNCLCSSSQLTLLETNPEVKRSLLRMLKVLYLLTNIYKRPTFQITFLHDLLYFVQSKCGSQSHLTVSFIVSILLN